MGMANPRTLNYPLGSMGQTLLELFKAWRQTISSMDYRLIQGTR